MFSAVFGVKRYLKDLRKFRPLVAIAVRSLSVLQLNVGHRFKAGRKERNVVVLVLWMESIHGV